MSENKPTSDKLNIKFWQEHPEHPARQLVDRLLATRNPDRVDEMISQMDKYWWYEIVREWMSGVVKEEMPKLFDRHRELHEMTGEILTTIRVNVLREQAPKEWLPHCETWYKRWMNL